jgi:hypothetical protein
MPRLRMVHVRTQRLWRFPASSLRAIVKWRSQMADKTSIDRRTLVRGITAASGTALPLVVGADVETRRSAIP